MSLDMMHARTVDELERVVFWCLTAFDQMAGLVDDLLVSSSGRRSEKEVEEICRRRDALMQQITNPPRPPVATGPWENERGVMQLERATVPRDVRKEARERGFERTWKVQEPRSPLPKELMIRPADLYEPPRAGPAPSGPQENPSPQAPPAGAAAMPLPQTCSPHPAVEATVAAVAPQKAATTTIGTSLAEDSKAPLESKDFAELAEALMTGTPEAEEKKETLLEAGASAQNTQLLQMRILW